MFLKPEIGIIKEKQTVSITCFLRSVQENREHIYTMTGLKRRLALDKPEC